MDSSGNRRRQVPRPQVALDTGYVLMNANSQAIHSHTQLPVHVRSTHYNANRDASLTTFADDVMLSDSDTWILLHCHR